jgi:hypothetical protein
MRGFYRVILWGMMLVVFPLAACASRQTIRPGQSISLAGFTDPANRVTVSIRLTRQTGGKVLLAATFTPPDGYHLYSKDIPRGGVRGQGRPTLIELSDVSAMRAAGPLAESVVAAPPGYNPDGPAVYPDGPVTLTLPVTLPAGDVWLDERVSLTYMPCTALECLAPTVGRLVAVHIPGAGLIEP